MSPDATDRPPAPRSAGERTTSARRVARVAAALAGLTLVLVAGNAVRVASWRAPGLNANPISKAGFRFLHGPRGPRALVALHNHTTASDGSGTLDDLVHAARAAGIDVLVVTDHDVFTHKPSEGWRDGVLVLVGSELSTDDGHLLALGLDEPRVPPSFETAGAIADVQAAGGLAIAAHPARRFGAAWRAPLDRVDGLEVANLDAGWRARIRPLAWLTAALLRPFRPVDAVLLAQSREDGALERFDQVLESRPVLAVGGSDAHGREATDRALFGTLTNVLLLDEALSGDVVHDRAQVLGALRSRHVLVANRALADPRGASYWGVYSDGTGGETDPILPGGVAGAPVPPRGIVGIAHEAGLDLAFETGLDRAADLRIVHRGAVVASGRGIRLAYSTTEPGAYRAEAWLDSPYDVPWIVTNAICLPGDGWPRTVATAASTAPATAGATGTPAATPSATGAAGTPDASPAEEPAESGETALEDVSAAGARPGIDLLGALAAEADSLSAIDVRQGRGRGIRGLRSTFSLGIPVPTHDVWCALVDRTPRAVGPGAALVLQATAREPMRIEIAFRLPGTGAVEGETFRRSLRLGPTPRRYRVPLDSFRSATSARRPPPLTSVASVLLLVTAETARPGSRGRIDVEVLRLE